MKRVVIVQARMTSTRLPGKVLMDLAGKPMLTRELERLRLCRRADEVMIATTVNATDDPVAALARAGGVRCFRGSEHDVLSRYVGAAREAGAGLVVRVTADCPFIDPVETDRVIAELESHPEADYASNVIERTFPRGLDAEAMTRAALDRMDRDARSPAAREHVTQHLLVENPGSFSIRSVVDSEDNSDLRWTVDTAEDLAMARALYEALGPDSPPDYRRALAVARARPDISALNKEVRQKPE